MHSHPRRRLPADRLPKLERKEKRYINFLTPKRINKSLPPQISPILNRQHGTPLWNVQQSSIEKTVPPFSRDHVPLKEKTRLWKGPLSWHHNLNSISYLWWRGKERILRARRSRDSHTSRPAMENVSTESSNFGVWRKQLPSSNSAQRHKDLFVCYFIMVPFGKQHRISWFSNFFAR